MAWLVVGYTDTPIYRIPLVHIQSGTEKQNKFTSLCGRKGDFIWRDAPVGEWSGPKVCRRCLAREAKP